ncbi:hypothetical protein [Hathewaya massiliensis]|uniref:hypothetical protein n=1 Tax=Hathewaya massiliensis TaxID=1964382 RepID=UPI00115A8367|nr:hypothetical protein [Hathewaya massiliensis]
MLVDKGRFKELKKEGGGIFKAIHATATLEYGIPEVKIGAILNLYIMSNGVLGDITLGSKIYINFNSITDATLSYDKLILDINENGANNQIVFKIKNTNELEKVYNYIRQYSNLGYKDAEITTRNEYKESKISNKSKRQEEKERVQQLKKERIPYCPKCHSTSITTQNKKLSVGRATVGGVLFGGVGAVLGGLTSNKIKKVCLNCGHKWK